LSSGSAPAKFQATRSEWYRNLANYEKPHTWKAIWQMINTFVPYVAIWVLMAYLLKNNYSYWLVLPLAALSAGFLARVFIFFHDCGHGCFLPSKRANQILGYITGIMTFTPFDEWRHRHAVHHASAGDLERRGVGDVWTMTVQEFLAAPKWTQIGYRVYRHPVVLFGLGPIYLFFIAQRFPHKESAPRERRSVHITNAGLLGVFILGGLAMGWLNFLVVQLTVMGLAAAFGVWLFYVQHQYEDVYWDHHADWDPVKAALYGSSYYKLPKILQWFSGNIGLHHIHHLKARIPNYNLQKCYDEVPEMQAVEPLTLRESVKSLFFNLWDEQSRKMISFRALKRMGLAGNRV
jgi:acyl-lipid omega-6 desaturase (Delta-12 desaturase)